MFLGAYNNQTPQRIRYMRHVSRDAEQDLFYWFLIKSQKVVINRIYFKKVGTELTT